MSCFLLLHAPFPPTVLLSDWQCRAICQPTILLLTFASLASLLMLLALITDIHFLLLPFMLSCVSVGICIIPLNCPDPFSFVEHHGLHGVGAGSTFESHVSTCHQKQIRAVDASRLSTDLHLSDRFVPLATHTHFIHFCPHTR